MKKGETVNIALVALAFLALAAASLARSPFLPAEKTPAVPQDSALALRLQNLEFTGFMTFAGELNFSFYDAASQRSYWIPINGSEDGLHVFSYDQANNRVNITINGQRAALSLKDNAIVPMTVVSAPVAAAPSKKPKYQKTAEQVRQEEEARTLVTDILQVGMEARERRRAEAADRLRRMREDAAKKAQSR